MKIAVTGGAGFIGSNVVDALIAEGHDVLVLDDLSSGRKANVGAKAVLLQTDIRSDECSAAIREYRPDAMFHFAAQMDVRKSVADPRFDADVNVLGLINLLEAARKVQVKRFIFASSGGAAYGEQSRYPADETHATAPQSPYGVAKIASELYLESYRQMYGLPWLALRYANVYGPRQSSQGEAGVVAIFAARLLEKKTCTIYGDGGQTRDFVFVSDVVRANLAALKSSFTGALNIGTGVETDITQLYREIAKAAGHDVPAVYAEGKPGEARRSSIDSARAGKVLGWKPEVPLAAGLAQTVAWFRAQARS